MIPVKQQFRHHLWIVLLGFFPTQFLLFFLSDGHAEVLSRSVGKADALEGGGTLWPLVGYKIRNTGTGQYTENEGCQRGGEELAALQLPTANTA